MSPTKPSACGFLAATGAYLGLFLLNLAFGSVNIPLKIFGDRSSVRKASKESWVYIIQNSRLPRVLTAALAGIALSASGLQMQTMFRNPLADPFILGIGIQGPVWAWRLPFLARVLWVACFCQPSPARRKFSLVLAARPLGQDWCWLILLVGRGYKTPTTDSGLMFGHATSAIVSILVYFSAPERIRLTPSGLLAPSAVSIGRD